MDRQLRLALAVTALVALCGFQGGGGTMPACDTTQTDHPCHCLRHVEQVQTDYMQSCQQQALQDDPRRRIRDIQRDCNKSKPDVCSIVEHYGNWSTGEDGEHDHPMPDQCRRACTRSHCKCSDSQPMCHFAHSPEK